MSKYKLAVEKHRQLILDALEYIWKNPETGYCEWKTHAGGCPHLGVNAFYAVG